MAAVPNLIYGCHLNERAWVLNVTEKLMQVWENEGPFDVLHTRLNPAMSHFAGLEVMKKIPSLAWCAYFSDPWPHHLYPEPYRFTVGPLSRIRLERVLDQILWQAGSLIFPSEQLEHYILKEGRAKFLKKSFVAPHLANAANVSAQTTDGILKFRHAGFLMKERKIDSLYEALHQFFSRMPEARTKVRFEFAGRYVGNVLPEPPEDLRDTVQFHSNMSPEAVSDWMQSADVFLLVEAKMKEGIFFPSKLSDYLAGNRPILALSPREGVTADFLRSGGGILAEPDDAGEIANALGKFYRLWQENRLGELLPKKEQIRSVSPEKVIPVYEQAFQKAIQDKIK